MADQSQTPQFIEMPPAFVAGDKPHEPADIGHNKNDNGVRSRNIEFDPVEVVGTPPQVIEIPPLEIVVPKPDSSAKEFSASSDSRVVLNSPSHESKSQQDLKSTESRPSPTDRINVETPQKELPTTDSDLSQRRQSWSDEPFDDHNEGGRLPSFVYPNNPEKKDGPKRKKRKKKKSVFKIILPPFVTSAEPQFDKLGNNPSDWNNWFPNAWVITGLTLAWAVGYKPPVIGGVPRFSDDNIANALKDSEGVKKARDFFYKKYKGRIDRGATVTDFDTTFGLKGLLFAGIDPVEQFVGTFKVEKIEVIDGNKLQYTISNWTSFTSFLYQMGHSWEGGSMGNFNQTFVFTEPIIADNVYSSRFCTPNP